MLYFNQYFCYFEPGLAQAHFIVSALFLLFIADSVIFCFIYSRLFFQM